MKKDKYIIKMNGKQVAIKYAFNSAKRHILTLLKNELASRDTGEHWEVTETQVVKRPFCNTKGEEIYKENVGLSQTWRNYRTGETYVFTIEKQAGE